MENKGSGKKVVNNKEQETSKNKRHVMILTSEKIIGNIGEQWKEVRDNRVKKTAH